MSHRAGIPAVLAATLAVTGFVFTGCGQPTLPLPPSLHLPQQVDDLTAQRTADNVTLRWTMPKTSTDKQPLKGPVTAEIYLRTVPLATPQTAPATQPRKITTAAFQPGSAAEVTLDSPEITASTAHEVDFWSVRLLNAKGRNAGSLLNEPETIGGPAVPVPANSTATNTEVGVLLSWKPLPGSDDATQSILVHRVLVTPPPNARPANLNQKPNSPPPAANDMLLTVPGDPGHAIDKTALKNAEYTYTLQRVTHSLLGDNLSIATRSGESAPLTLNTKDTYPPAQPTGLAAVPGTTNSVDLSWQPNTETDLAGYIVYRRIVNPADTSQRISPLSIGGTRITTAPLTAPAYRDATTSAGARYLYCISAVDTSGNESPCSTAETITLP